MCCINIVYKGNKCKGDRPNKLLTHFWLGIARDVSISAIAPKIWSVRPWFFGRDFIFQQPVSMWLSLSILPPSFKIPVFLMVCCARALIRCPASNFYDPLECSFTLMMNYEGRWSVFVSFKVDFSLRESAVVQTKASSLRWEGLSVGLSFSQASLPLPLKPGLFLRLG